MNVEELIDKLKESEAAYDTYLQEAFNGIIPDSKGGFKPMSEDRAKLHARQNLRIDGHELPHIIMLRIWAKIGIRVVTSE